MSEQTELLEAVELLRVAANNSYDASYVDRPLADPSESLTICGVPRYLLFMKIHKAMIHLQNQVWGFEE